MSKRPRGRIPVYTDSQEQRVTRHISLAEAHKLAEQSGYEWVDDNDPHKGLFVKTIDRSERLPIGRTITFTELIITAGAKRCSDLREAEVNYKIAHYDDTGMDIGNYCPWPPPESMSFNRHAPVVGCDMIAANVSKVVRDFWLTRLGLRQYA